MPAYPYFQRLMDYASVGAAPAEVVGATRRFAPRDPTPELNLTATRFTARCTRVGGTTPTVAVFIEFSVDDGENWAPFQVLSLSGSATEASVVLPEAGVLVQPLMRARVVVGGAPRPQVNVVVEVVCSDPFTLS